MKLANKMAKEFIQESKSQVLRNNWISVKDRLPKLNKVGEDYYESDLVWVTDGFEVSMAYFSKKNNGWERHFIIDNQQLIQPISDDFIITAWQSLNIPKPPNV